MTQNSAHKKAARQFQQQHPGTTYPEAMRRTKYLNTGDRVRCRQIGTDARVYGIVSHISDDKQEVGVVCDGVLQKYARKDLEYMAP